MTQNMNLKEYCLQNNLEYILEEWDYTKNNDKSPSDFAPKSNKQPHWKCRVCGYEWTSRIADRTMGKGCSVCAGKTVMIGYNDLKTLNPELCEEWNYAKNTNLTPEQFTLKSSKKVWWKCSKCGHEWKASIANRSNGSGCPNCLNINNGLRVINEQINKNGSLKDSGLSYMEEWDYEKNNIDPSMVTISSNTNVWWKCKKCGHSWDTTPNARNQGNGCPKCNSSLANQKKILFHLNRDGSFADNHPEFIKYWDFQLNNKSCYELTSKSAYEAHWRCPDCGHEWTNKIYNMSKSKGCPRCVENQTVSSLQMMTEEYLLSYYDYEVKHERDCSISPVNPKTNYPLLYDNEVIIDNTNRLIIEVHGQQHYSITEYVKKDAIKHNVTPEEELEYIQWKDKYKKQYALDHGYYYLELPYWVFKDESYKILISQKIQNILVNNTKLTNTHCASVFV